MSSTAELAACAIQRVRAPYGEDLSAVETGYSWTDRYALDRILEVR